MVDYGFMVKMLWWLFDGVFVESVFMCYFGCVMICVLS